MLHFTVKLIFYEKAVTLVLGRLCDEFETFYDILELAKADNFEIMKNEFDNFLYDKWGKYNQD
jgi:hypothetical protein